MSTLVAYKNDPKLKAAFVAEIEKHKQADQILQGTYGEQNGKWRGCAVACSLRSLDILNGKKLRTKYSEHERYESELGIPEWLARLEDTIFEGLPKEQAMEWPLRFSKAIPVGVNLEPVKYQFCAYILSQNIERVLTLDIADDLKEEVVSAIRGVLQLHENAIKTGKWQKSAAESAGSAAWSAAGSAGSAAKSAAWSAAGSAAWSAGSAAKSAAESAGSAAKSAAGAAKSAAFEKFADKLIELLEASK